MITCKIQLHDIGNTCPVCGEQALDAAFDEREDGEHLDTFKCDHCGMLVTYISPDDGRGEYRLFHDGEITVEFDLPLPWIPSETPIDELFQIIDDIIAAEEMGGNDQGYKFLIELVQRAKDVKAKIQDEFMPETDVLTLPQMVLKVAKKMIDEQSASDNPASQE